MTGPSPDQIRAAYDSPAQRTGRAIVERQVELNEIRTTAGLPVHTTHDQLLAAIRAMISDKTDLLATVTRLRDELRARTEGES